MKLSKITTDPSRFQFRDALYSERTVDSIVDAGIDVAQFDPIPVVIDGDRAIVAGDGHSRYEALRRLAEDGGQQGRLPDAWRDSSGDWDIPARVVTMDDALRLAYVANMGRSPFSAPEEARIFQARLDRGESMAEIAATSHRSVGYVQKRLRLNCLCRTIREAVGQPWGIDTDKAIVLAESLVRHEIGHQLQQQLWYEVISQGDWTQRSIKLFMDRIAPKMKGGSESADDAMLFELAPNIKEAVRAVTGNAQHRRRARRGLQWLIQAVDVLDVCPELESIVRDRGAEILDALTEAENEDADVLGALVAA